MNLDQLAAGLGVPGVPAGETAGPGLTYQPIADGPGGPGPLRRPRSVPLRALMYNARGRIPDPPSQQPPPRNPAKKGTINVRDIAVRVIADLELTVVQTALLSLKSKDYDDGKLTNREFLYVLGDVVGKGRLACIIRKMIREKKNDPSTRKWSFLPNEAPEETAPSECKVCFVNMSQVAFVPCGHVCICLDCTDKLPSMRRVGRHGRAKCPMCNLEREVLPLRCVK